MKRIKYEVEITYDEKTDMGYIYLVPIQKVKVSDTKGKYPILYDVNENNRIVGIEIFHANLIFPEEIKTLLDK
ncbi:MAG TPA: DUF2283 domain-containing protein [Bacilli bacterium]|jgi:uncharacterized protein YuzE|nr:DUF2283 domain-containing protein [Bacilli bacterium]